MKAKIAIIFLIIIFSTFHIPLYATSQNVDRLIDQGIQYERQNQLDKAIEIYRQVLEKDKANLLVKIRLAKILSWKNQFDEALVLLNEVLQDDPYQSEALFRKAQILSWQGSYRDAIATYQTYLLKEPDDPEALMGIARVSFWSEEHEKAITYFNKAIGAGANEIDARLDLGKVYLAINKKEEAKEQFERILEINPENQDAEKFLKGIRTMKVFEISPMGFQWNVYPDGTFSITLSSGVTYHLKQVWDFFFTHENKVINSAHDNKFQFNTVFKGITNLYLLEGFSFTPDPDFSPSWGTEFGINYNFPNLFSGGVNLLIDFYSRDTLFTVNPTIKRDFTDISYISLGYNQYVFTSGYSTGNVELLLNLEYANTNSLFVQFVYGGDTEVRDRDRRIFDLVTGTTFSITDNFETTLSYGWVDSPYGRSHEIGWRSVAKW